MKCNSPPASITLSIYWNVPLFSWIKCNFNGASKGNHGVSAACGGLIRDWNGDLLGGFAANLESLLLLRLNSFD